MLRNYFRKAYRTVMPLLYSRSNYKLFLQRTFTDLDERIRTITCATDVMSVIVKPVPIKAPFGNSMFVVAPHQDDETIGCGGAMLLQIAKGKEVHIVFIQDGGDEHKEDGVSRNEMINIREQESCNVASKMGISRPKFLRHAYLSMENISKIAGELRIEIDKVGADVIFVPFFLDYNHDHRMANYALAEALTGMSSHIRVYGYEVWGLCVPNVILNIDTVIKDKQKLLSCYESQIKGTDYVNCTTGLNMYHSRAFGAGVCKYAERFFEIPGKEYVQVVNKIRMENQIG